MNKQDIIDELKSNIKTTVKRVLSENPKKLSPNEIDKLADKLVSEVLYNLDDEGGFSIKCGNIEIHPIDDIDDL